MKKNYLITTSIAIKTGTLLIVVSVVLCAIAFGPLIYQESKYQIQEISSHNIDNNDVMVDPIGRGFSITIPKIDATSSVIVDVDPYNSDDYLKALTQGVAHARNSAKPDEQGNVFLFAHSSDNFYNANRYNSVFFLLYKIEINDTIYVTYEDRLFTYKVVQKEIVKPEMVDYLTYKAVDNTLTLMTCWPPGTTSKRLIIVAR